MIEKKSDTIFKSYPLANLEFDAANKILFFRVVQDIEVDTHEINQMIIYAQELAGETPHYGIVNFGSNVMSSSEARKIYADCSYIQKFRIANAFVVESLALKLIANFFIRVTKPVVPTKMFNNEVDSLSWINSLKEKN